MRALYANCFPPAEVEADLLLTDERSVAEHVTAERSMRSQSPERAVDPARAHATSLDVWQLAFSWYRSAGVDHTVVEGISAGDIAGLEAAITVLVPAARGALSMASLLEQGTRPSTLLSVTPHDTPGGARYDRLEHLSAEAAIAAARRLVGENLTVERLESRHPRNAQLRDKYIRARDPQLLAETSPARTARRWLFDAADRVALVRRRRGRSLLVVEYNPTLAFSRAYSARPGPRRRLVRWMGDPRDAPAAIWAGDIVASAPGAGRAGPRHAVADRVARDGDALDGAGFTVAGVPLWPVVSRPLLDLLAHYATFVERRAGAVREQLQRYDVDAVLVPFDGSPAVRLLVRVAQSLGIPTFVLNDGYKGDELQIEGMSTDVALAWSEAIREHYYARHPGPVLVTGNPKFSTVTPPARALRQDRPPRLLVGTFTFSPIDLNCRRSDAEDFLDQVLEGIAGALPSAASEVVVKLHPADEPAHYRELVARYPQLEVTLTSAGDVVELFAEADIYLTTYSTSLLEAARTMPVVYYRVNEQRLGPPFDGDEYLTPRTASTPGELAALLRDRDRLVAAPPAWIEHYLGPAGALERIVDAIEGQLRRGSPAAGARTAPDAARGA